MLDQRLQSVISGLISVERSRRVVVTKRALIDVRDDYTRRGALGHGRLPVDMEGVCATELEQRGAAWLAVVRRAFAESSTRWTPANADAIRELLLGEFTTDWGGLLDLYRESVQPHQNPSKRFGALDAAQGRRDAETTEELRLLVLGEDRSRVPVAEQLMAPRYADVLASWTRAASSQRATGEERVEAIRYAVGAVEQLVRVVTNSPTATLGKAVDALRRDGRVEAPLLKGIDELWGWTSDAPGLRHGASASEQPSSAKGEYALKLAEAALVLLLSLDVAEPR